MKIITQNLHCFAEKDYLKKFDQIAQFIVENDIDIICFQEVAQPKDTIIVDGACGIKEGNAALLIRDMVYQKGGSKYQVLYSFAHYYYGTDEEGVAILTRVPITSWKEHVISEEQEIVMERRTALEIQLKNGISISSLHLGISKEKGEISPALHQFLKLQSETKGTKKLFFGDYNIPDTTEAYEEILKSGCIDLFGDVKGNNQFLTTPDTIDGWQNDKGAKRLDYGFANTSIKVNEARVIFNGKSEVTVSDHFGLYFDIEL